MDPVACLKAFDDAIKYGDTDEIIERANDLVGWLLKMGFMPFEPGSDDQRASMDRGALARYLRDMARVASIAGKDDE